MSRTVQHNASCVVTFLLLVLLSFILSGVAEVGPAAENLPKDVMLSDRPMDGPITNAAFIPGDDAMQADRLHATISIKQTVGMYDPIGHFV